MDSPSPDTRVDLRSDTVTLPTEAMYERMRAAALGDDGLDGDPTARELEHFAASLLGKAAGLYVPTATMANTLAILAQAPRQSVVLAGEASHVYVSERGAATFTGAFYQPIPDPGGVLDEDRLGAAVASTRGNLQATLLCMETSHNNEGGAVAPLAHMARLYARAKGAGLDVHLDGARLFNAAVALEVMPSDLCAHADTVAVCLSKGLSAPMGALLVGPQDVVREARWLRKLLGGTQRQVGIAAAAGIEGLGAMTARLADDHAQARALALGLAGVPGLRVRPPQTNIVQVDVGATGRDARAWVDALAELGVLVRAWGPALLRCVTHRHVDADAVGIAIAAFAMASQGNRTPAHPASTKGTLP